MSVFRTNNHMLRLRVLPFYNSCPCRKDFICSSYSGFRSLKSCFSVNSSHKARIFCSSHQSLSCSTDTRNNSLLMELGKTVATRGSTFPESIAIRADKKSYSYHQLILSAKRISDLLNGSNLKSVNGIGENKYPSGARIGIVARPSPEFVAGVLGTWFSGCVAVPLALSYPEAELLHVMNDSDIAMILSTEDHLEIMKAVAAKTSSLLSLLAPVPDIVAKSNEIDPMKNGETDKIESSLETRGDDPALIIYTSGTTGKPKGVVHTHKGVLAQLFYCSSQFNDLAWCHVKFKCLLKHGVTHRLISSCTACRYIISSKVFCFSNSSFSLFGSFLESYLHYLLSNLKLQGLSFVMAISNPLNGKRKGATVGNPLPGVEAKIIAEDGNAEVGELCIRSPSLFKEYWKLPEVTKGSFIDGGFFKTGDAARVDEDGYYVILGRTNADIMKVGGYKLSALEIEAVLLEHPTISECCVLGLPDKDLGEVVCAIVVPDSEIKRKREKDLKPILTLEELSGWAKEKLAPYKIPTRLLIWESLPRNAMGKVNKKELKKKLADQV
ncbi:acyl-CoA synthetase family member 3 [Striga asiatica]|uniref:Acyl-CoA synthetase family member 3 n=1 Tax=Striga asiatica TaxID=4170 RepID=A0A5A7QTX4_STRAF|nr:acyl-CoA synthetase family member 3 [Striga asiatica]